MGALPCLRVTVFKTLPAVPELQMMLTCGMASDANNSMAPQVLVSLLSGATEAAQATVRQE